MSEEAVIIPDNELALIQDNYFVSKKGSIFSNKQGRLKELIPEKISGYLRVKLFYNSVGKNKSNLLRQMPCAGALGLCTKALLN